eukprot:3922938-Prymnesium_polylepis.1
MSCKARAGPRHEPPMPCKVRGAAIRVAAAAFGHFFISCAPPPPSAVLVSCLKPRASSREARSSSISGAGLWPPPGSPRVRGFSSIWSVWKMSTTCAAAAAGGRRWGGQCGDGSDGGGARGACALKCNDAAAVDGKA